MLSAPLVPVWLLRAGCSAQPGSAGLPMLLRPHWVKQKHDGRYVTVR